MSKITPDSDMYKTRIGVGGQTHAIPDGKSVLPSIFVRITRRGIAVATQYETTMAGETYAAVKVEAAENGFYYQRYYRHDICTTRQAALLVSRFWDDVDQLEVQP